MKKKSLIDENGEVRELTADDLKKFKPASDVLPPDLLSVLSKRGRPVKQNPKVSTTIRLSPEVITYFKSRGKGWQTEVDQILSRHVKMAADSGRNKKR